MAAEASRPLSSIEVVDLSAVVGGLDRQTSQAELAIARATSAMTDIARSVAPKDASTTQMMLELLSRRGPGAGPTSAPALPPTSTLTR